MESRPHLWITQRSQAVGRPVFSEAPSEQATGAMPRLSRAGLGQGR
jgi:hypothetical protein